MRFACSTCSKYSESSKLNLWDLNVRVLETFQWTEVNQLLFSDTGTSQILQTETYIIMQKSVSTSYVLLAWFQDVKKALTALYCYGLIMSELFGIKWKRYIE